MADHFPQRIVCLQPSATVILEAVGALARVVACTRYCVDVCPEAGAGRAVVADSWRASAGEIAAVQPDLVIASVPYRQEAITEILKAGARFLGFAPKMLADIYTDIAAIAGVVGEGLAGERVIAQMQSAIDTVRKKAQGAARPRVFCEEWGKPVIASQRWVAELVEAAGGEPIGSPGAQTSAESVLRENPDVLIASWCGAGDRVPLEKLVNRPGWKSMRAVREARVYCIRDEFLNTPAPTLLYGLRALAAAIHPEGFAAPPGLIRISNVMKPEGEVPEK